MALTASQIASRLFKKSLNAGETLVSRQFFEEPRLGAQFIFSDQIWSESSSIPAQAPVLSSGASAGVVQYFEKELLTHVPGSSNLAYYSINLVDSIPFNYGTSGTYNYQLYKNDGTTAIAFGEGDWLVDNSAGLLTFYGTLPSAVTSASPPRISFYKYIGAKGVSVGSGTSSGSNGSSGTSGITGTSGSSGTSGSGTHGSSGTSGISGVTDNDWLYFQPSSGSIPSSGNVFVLSGTTASYGGVSYATSSGRITLSANKTYNVRAVLALANAVGNLELNYQWINVTAGSVAIGNVGALLVNSNSSTAAWQPVAEAIITPLVTTQIALKSIYSSATGGLNFSMCYFLVQEINGYSGTSGTSGVGTSGTSGQGTSGTSGFEGTSGTSGSEGTSGTSGQEGTSGTSGFEGTSGTSGQEGTSGTSGFEGTSGTSGQGTSGTSGITPNQNLEQTLAVGNSVGTYSIYGIVGVNQSVLDMRNAGFSSGGFRLITTTHSSPSSLPPAYMLNGLSTPFNDISAQTNDSYKYIDIASIGTSSKAYISLDNSRTLLEYSVPGGGSTTIRLTRTQSIHTGTASFLGNVVVSSNLSIPSITNTFLATDAAGLIVATTSSPGGGSGTSGTSGAAGGGGTGSSTGSFTLVLDGQGGVVSTGQKGYFQAQYNGTITGYSIIASPTGSVSFDVWKRSGSLPTVSDSIVGGNYPGITAGTTFSTTTLSGWTTSFSNGDYFGWNVRSSGTASWVRLELTTLKI